MLDPVRPPGRVRASLLALVASLAACDGSLGPTAVVEETPGALRVTLTASGDGSGRIAAEPWIDCRYRAGVLSGTCSAEVAAGTSLSLVATPGETAINGVPFGGWGGACAASGDQSCHLTVVDEPLTASAVFPGVTRVHGVLQHAQDGAFGPLRVGLRADGEDRGTVPVAADGTFDALLAGSVRGADGVELLVDAPPPAPRTVFPAWVSLEPWELADPVRLVMVPRIWRVERGMYAGASLELDLMRALEAEPAFYLTTGEARAATDWRFQVQTVTEDRLPLSLVLDPGRSTVPVAEIDVERYWRRIDELEAAFGFDLFERAEAGPAEVVVAVAPGACGRATACANVASGDPYLDTRASVFHQSVEQFRRERGIVQHELTHVLGMGHTCEWPSLMSAGAEACDSGEEVQVDPTVADAAYLHLALRVNTRQKATGFAEFGGGIMAAWNGYRVAVLGELPWIPPGCELCGG